MTDWNKHKPCFFWQGILILLPALLLAGFGLYSLRQDRLFVRLEVEEQAKGVVNKLAQMQLPQWFNLERELAVLAAKNAEDGTPQPEDDVISAALDMPLQRILWRVSESGELLYPPPFLEWAPQFLDSETLSDAQYDLWHSIQELTGVSSDSTNIFALCQEFLANQPPADYAAHARYQLGHAYLNAGVFAEARDCFEQVIFLHPRILSEAGIPYTVSASFGLIEACNHLPVTPTQRSDIINRLCQKLIFYDGFWTDEFLAEVFRREKQSLSGVDPKSLNAPKWIRIRKQHELSRAMHSLWKLRQEFFPLDSTNRVSADWIELASGVPWLTMRSEFGGSIWMQAISKDHLQEGIEEIIGELRLAPYIDMQIDIAGKKIIESSSGAEAVLAVSELSAAGLPQARVEARLANPAMLYARQMRRSLQMGGLILLSLAAVGIGFWTARRSFWRQHHLNMMKTNFVSSVSHELRAPIASMRLMAEELEILPTPKDSKWQKYAGFIVQESRRLSALIENVLDFARYEEGRKHFEFEPTNMVALVVETSRLMHVYGSPHRITVTSDVVGNPVEIDVDGRAIQQVLVNLLDNAIKNSPEGGIVKTAIEFPRENIADGAVVLWVEDQGQGIPEEEHERIFKPFYRRGSELRRETQGVGLGLTIVKQAVEAHGGSVSVQSKIGQGSRFIVRLPLQRKVTNYGSHTGN